MGFQIIGGEPRVGIDLPVDATAACVAVSGKGPGGISGNCECNHVSVPAWARWRPTIGCRESAVELAISLVYFSFPY